MTAFVQLAPWLQAPCGCEWHHAWALPTPAVQTCLTGLQADNCIACAGLLPQCSHAYRPVCAQRGNQQERRVYHPAAAAAFAKQPGAAMPDTAAQEPVAPRRPQKQTVRVLADSQPWAQAPAACSGLVARAAVPRWTASARLPSAVGAPAMQLAAQTLGSPRELATKLAGTSHALAGPNLDSTACTLAQWHRLEHCPLAVTCGAQM